MGGNNISKAVVDGDYSKVNRLLDAGADTEYRHKGGITLACVGGLFPFLQVTVLSLATAASSSPRNELVKWGTVAIAVVSNVRAADCIEREGIGMNPISTRGFVPGCTSFHKQTVPWNTSACISFPIFVAVQNFLDCRNFLNTAMPVFVLIAPFFLGRRNCWNLCGGGIGL